ncbi:MULTISPECIES: TRAP transporter small permease [unclassified Novosphingobium]|uniref:TRAP transporter small permease n=1 Tax=unclassified Novosphingobium TaxID=2644732 RepID=UPI0025E4BD1C|nr:MULTISPECIES: TRAP transporter small permease subunit [unclassified Novosphingobium]HQS68098.1 TRAP transporter small permease subunit [Novosphingobium sp.]
MTLTGGIALLAATGIDTISVIGRHVGMPFRGSIELVQVAVLVAGTLALLVATVDRSHAKVHLLVDRMSEPARAMLDRVSALLGALFFAALLAGAAWLMADLWSGHEESEVVGVPWRWMRLFANVVFLAIVLALLGQAIRRRKP